MREVAGGLRSRGVALRGLSPFGLSSARAARTSPQAAETALSAAGNCV